MSAEVSHAARTRSHGKALVLRNYAARTVDTYVSLLRRYLEQLKKPIEDVIPTDIQEWQFSLVGKKLSWSLFNQAVFALKFYFKRVRNCEWSELIPFQRTRRRLPVVLSRDEVARLLEASRRNPKHYAMVATLYSTGLRLGELLSLKIPDIDSAEMLVHVHQGKGGKDRQVQLSPQPSRNTARLLSSLPCQTEDLAFPGSKARHPNEPERHPAHDHHRRPEGSHRQARLATYATT